MSILAKFLNLIKSSQYHIFLAACIGLIAFISYNLGKISSNEIRWPIKVTEQANLYKAVTSEEKGSGNSANTPKLTPRPLDTRVVISGASTSKKYHYSWCPGAKKINEVNKVWFGSDKEAEVAGYTLAGNCSK